MPFVQQPYSNAATTLHPIEQQKKVRVAMQNRNPGESDLWPHIYTRCMEATQDRPFSLDCLCEVD